MTLGNPDHKVNPVFQEKRGTRGIKETRETLVKKEIKVIKGTRGIKGSRGFPGFPDNPGRKVKKATRESVAWTVEQGLPPPLTPTVSFTSLLHNLRMEFLCSRTEHSPPSPSHNVTLNYVEFLEKTDW